MGGLRRIRREEKRGEEKRGEEKRREERKREGKKERRGEELSPVNLRLSNTSPNVRCFPSL